MLFFGQNKTKQTLTFLLNISVTSNYHSSFGTVVYICILWGDFITVYRLYVSFKNASIFKNNFNY